MSTPADARLALIEEKIEFIMNSVMLPQKIKGLVTPQNPQGFKTALIPLLVMWNTLQEVKARMAREKAEILGQNNG
jgi:hypothetical protein